MHINHVASALSELAVCLPLCVAPQPLPSLPLDLELQVPPKGPPPGGWRGCGCLGAEPAGGGCGRPLAATQPSVQWHPQPLTAHPSLQLFDLIYREETLFNVIKSVTRNGRSILLTALLALILVYLFSIVGFLFLKDDFILEVDRLPNNHSRGPGPLSGRCGVTGSVQVTDVRARAWDCLSPRPSASVSRTGFWGGVGHTSLPWDRLRGRESLGSPLPCRACHSP